MRARLAFFSLLFTAVLAVPCLAQTAADKATARKLANEGIELYQAGNYAEALDKLTRAQKLFDAPVHLLFIARSQAKQGKLVDAAETYRKLIRVKLEPNAPDAFREAVEDAKKELGDVEAAVPTLRLEVSPADAPSLKLSIDGEAVSAAVLGVDRAIDPGEHVVVATADGYARSEQKVSVARAEHKSLSVVLQADGSAPRATKDAEKPAETTPAAGGEKKLGFFVGVRLLGAIPAGSAGNVSVGVEREFAMSDLMETGGGLELHGGLRFARYFAAKLYVDGFGMRPGSETADDTQVTGVEAGIGGSVGTAPHRLGGFGEVGIGLVQSFQLRTENMTADCVNDVTWSGGPTFRIGGGAVIPLSKYFQLTPFMVANFSQFNHVALKVECEDAALATPDVDQDIAGDDRRGHQLFLLGVGVDWLIGG